MNTALSAPDRTSTNIHVLRRIFSFPVMLACLLAMLAVATVRERFDDPDMWWHLKTGEVLWTTHTIPTTDLFSYTTNHHAWIPHEWLSQVLIYGTYRLGGYSGLMLWLCFFTAALLIAGYILCSLYSGNSKTALLGALTIWLFGTIGFAIRPQMIGYLLLIVELLVLHLGQTRNRRWFFGLPPLFAIWINCHGSFFFGLGLAGVFLFSSYFNFQGGSLVATSWDPRRRRTMTLALILSVAALFLNPVGVKMILYPMNTMLDSAMLNPVTEWQPLQFSDGRSFAFLGVLGCIFLLVIVRRTELLWRELLMLALGAWLAASHVRMLFVFGILAAPILSRLLSDTWDGYNAERDRPLPNAVLIAASLLLVFLAFPNRQNIATQVEEHSPVKAVEFIKTHRLSGPMLNEWRDGGYLIWATPEHPVFIDGRADPFGETGVMGEFGKWAQVQTDPNTLLNKYGISFCVLSRESPMVGVLRLLPGWKEVYSDNVSAIFVRSAPSSPRGLPQQESPSAVRPAKRRAKNT
jgi:hypothetical protein